VTKASWKVLAACLKLSLTLGLFYVLATRAELDRTLELALNASPLLLAATIVVLFFQLVIAACRWQRILHQKDIDLSLPDCVRYFWTSLFFNQFLPSSVGGDAVRTYFLVCAGHGVGRATLTVLLDRMFGMIGLLFLIIVFLPHSLQLITDEEMRWGLVLGIVAALAGLGVGIALDQVTKRIQQWRVARGLATLAMDGRRLLLSPSQGPRLIALSMLVHLLTIAAASLLSLSLGLDPNWQALAVVIPIATLLIMIPVSIAGWGVREGVMVVGLGYAAIGVEEALALSLLVGLSQLMISLPGGALWLLNPRQRLAEVQQVLKDDPR